MPRMRLRTCSPVPSQLLSGTVHESADGPRIVDTSYVSAEPKPAALSSPCAGVVLDRVRVQCFRGIADVTLELERGTTFLVGENNAGKSSLLQALAVAVGSRQATSDDLRRLPSGRSAGDAIIDVWIAPTSQREFDDSTRQRLGSVQRQPGTNHEVVGIRTILKPSDEGSGLRIRRLFLQPSGNDWVASQQTVTSQALDLLDAHMLDASRDLMTELGARSSTWGRVVADLKIPERPQRHDGSDDPLGRAALESDLRLLAGNLRAASPVLGQLEKDLSGVAQAQATVGRVELVPVPPDVDELARTIQVVLHQEDRLSLPLRFHGLGSRSLAALFVFQTLCGLRIGADQGLRPHLLILLEEPESHLHPQAVVALRDLIDALPGQTIVATHSTHLVAESSPEIVRLVRRSPDGSRILRLPPDDAKRIAQFRRFIERPFGEIFFARLVVFVDGTSERNALPILLKPVLGCDVGGLGVTFVDCESMVEDRRLQRLVDALHAIEIGWLMFVDNDEAGVAALVRITDPATGQALTTQLPTVVLSGRKQIEQLLLDAGYEEEIEAVAAEANQPISDGRHLKFLTSNKPWAAEAVARRAVNARRASHRTIDELAKAIRAAIPATNTQGSSDGSTE